MSANEENAYENVQCIHKLTKRISVFGDNFYSATGSAPVGPWKPRVLRGIQNYPPEFGIRPEQFMENYCELITECNASPSEERRQLLRQFLLQSVLPYMETRLENNGLASPEILKVLPLLCGINDVLVDRYALGLILTVLSKNSYENVQTFILESEELLRSTIMGENGSTIFDTQSPEDQGLRVFVYSRVLMVLTVLIKQGHIRMAAWKGKERVYVLYEKLSMMKDESPFKEKKRPRYAVACIRLAAESCITRQNRFCQFLNWLHEYYQKDEGDNEERDHFLKKFVGKVTSNKNGWFDFHIVISCLVPRIDEDPKVMTILRILVEQYISTRGSKSLNPMHWLKWSDEAKWQTGVLVGDILENVVMNNKNDAARKEACASLCLYVAALSDNKNSTEKLYVEQSLKRCCFGPPQSIRPLMLSKLRLHMEEFMTVLSSMDFLESTRYKNQMLPHGHQLCGKDANKVLFRTHFRGEMAMVKILVISSEDDVDQCGDKTESGKHYENLFKEAYFLRRLNSKPHPNILKVFAYDTVSQPYHLITEYVHRYKSTLLQYLQSTRSDVHHMPNPSTLILMMLGIVEGLIYLDEQHLVHTAIMSNNVLVGMDRICKLTGFQALREMSFNEEAKEYEYVSKDDETPIRHAAPEILTDGRYSEKSMVFGCGYLLYEVHTYGVTPYNWLKNDETEKIRSHVITGGRPPEEECIPQPISDLMKDCHHHEPNERPNLVTLKTRLTAAHKALEESADADRLTAEYPPLSQQDLLHTQMSSCIALDGVEHSKILGFFGCPTRAEDIAVIQNIRGTPQIRELVEKTKEEDLNKLKELNNENVVKVLSISLYSGKEMALVTENSERGNLLSLVLAKECSSTDIVRSLTQILSGLIYMHDSNLLHCDIRAEHMMVFYDDIEGIKVKISRLGRSTYLRTSPMECGMPKDAFRRSAPEVIKNNTYSCSSDVYSFGMMCYELYKAQGEDKGCQPMDVEPLGDIKDNEILAYLEGNNRPPKPSCMPMWLYTAVKQCLLHKPEERPPFILLHDCFTYRKPFDSCLLSRWKEFHPHVITLEKIDVEVDQPSIPFHDHVIPPEMHLSFDDLIQLSPVAVFMEHSYKYAAGNNHVDSIVYEDIYDDMSGVLDSIGTVKKFEESQVDEEVIYDDVEGCQHPPQLPPPRQPPRPRPRPRPRSSQSGNTKPVVYKRPPVPYPRGPVKCLCHDEHHCLPNEMENKPIQETSKDCKSTSNNLSTAPACPFQPAASSENNMRGRSRANDVSSRESSWPSLPRHAVQNHSSFSSQNPAMDDFHDYDSVTNPYYENMHADMDGATEQSWHSSLDR